METIYYVASELHALARNLVPFFFFLNELEGPMPLQDFITKMKVEARYKTAESTKEFGSSISNRHGSHTTKQGDLQQARLTTWPTRLHNQRY